MSFSNNMALLYFKIGKAFSKEPTYEMMLKVQEIEDKRKSIKIPKNVDIEYLNFKNIQSEFLSKKDNPKNKVVIYIHGGGFNSGNAKSRRDIALYIVTKMHYDVLNINYRLAPKYKFPCAQEDVIEQYKYLLEQYKDNIVVMGESAGGNLTLSLPFMCKKENIALPKALISISPVVQYDKLLDSYIKNKKSDPIVDAQKEVLKESFFVDKKDCLDPIAAPYHGDFKNYPPTMLIASDSETLYDDSIIFYEKLKKFNIESKLVVKHNMMHAFAMTTMFPESKEALIEAKDFIDLYT